MVCPHFFLVFLISLRNDFSDDREIIFLFCITAYYKIRVMRQSLINKNFYVITVCIIVPVNK